ncbi:MAG: hypothetical protein JWQ21_3736 [Herminiimonas sp.]|nr:hypothetical protein [Herminiimonas sp.]
MRLAQRMIMRGCYRGMTRGLSNMLSPCRGALSGPQSFEAGYAVLKRFGKRLGFRWEQE